MEPVSIPYGRQSITEEDIGAVTKVLASDWLTQGPAVERFEMEAARYAGARYAVAVNSATSALHIACAAAGLGAGDYLWTSPNTFVASANCALYCGAYVDFVDIEPETRNMSVEGLEKRLLVAKKTDKLPKAVVPVHFAGHSCDMAGISRLAGRFGFRVIEDAAHAIGGSYGGTMVGSCAFSDMTVFSFHPVKIITTGEGGMVTTNDASLYHKLLRLRSHGITRDPGLMRRKPDGPWYYQQLELGYNYRMTDIQAALGSSQLKRIDAFVARRRFLAGRYGEALRDMPLAIPAETPGTLSAWHLYAVRLKTEECGMPRREVFEALRKAGINVNVHYIPVHTQPFYRDMGFMPGDFPEAENYYSEALSLPLYYGLTEGQQDYIIKTLDTILR